MRTPGAIPALLLVLAAGAGSAEISAPPSPAPPPAARVRLDRLTWAPDGNSLAVEATLEEAGSEGIDTLLVDLTRGGLAVRNPFPLLLAFDDRHGRLAAATRHTWMAGPAAHPESVVVLARRNPTGPVRERLAFSAGGESLMVLSRPPEATFYEISALSLARGRESLVCRVTGRGEADREWARRTGGAEALPVSPTPFPTLYVPVRGALFTIERSVTEVKGVEGVWLFDLFRRVPAAGQEQLLVQHVAPWATALSPDSAWLAVAGTLARPDFGGGLQPGLWLAATDGSLFFSVRPEGVRDDRPVEITSMGWCGGTLWYTTRAGLYRVEPGAGRSRAVCLGPPPPEWSASLAPAAQVWTLFFTEHAPDTAGPAIRVEKLRRQGWPAWVAGPPAGPFHVAVGSEEDSDRLEPLAVAMEEAGISGFMVKMLDAVASGDPWPYGAAKGPLSGREAWLCAVGPVGFPAGELRLAEQHGARQVRLITAMWRPAGAR